MPSAFSASPRYLTPNIQAYIRVARGSKYALNLWRLAASGLYRLAIFRDLAISVNNAEALRARRSLSGITLLCPPRSPRYLTPNIQAYIRVARGSKYALNLWRLAARVYIV